MDSGETRVLPKYTGTFWSLLDSKWSLKIFINVYNPPFELLELEWYVLLFDFKDSFRFDYIMHFNDEMLLIGFTGENLFCEKAGL